MIVFCILSAILVQRVFYLQIVKGQDYLDDYKLQIQKTKEVQGTRGRILDRNGVVLADNKLAYAVTIEDNGDYDTTAEKNEIINETITKVIDIVESNGDAVINNFKVVLDDSGNYVFSMTNDTQRLRFLADIFGYATIDKLSEKERAYTAEDIIDHLCTDKQSGYGIDQSKYTKEEVLKRINIRYAMSLNRFQKYVATTIASDVSEETQAAIMENMDSLQGVNIAEDSLRVYNDSKYFANILGYTGQISQDEYDGLEDDIKEKYSLTDIIGKAGLEQVMDEQLQGTKGEIKLYVNSVGKVIETTKGTEAQAGNDLQLTIDAELQKTAYDLLEEKLAGIVLANLQNVMNYDRSGLEEGSDAIIPIDDVYYSFFGNEIFDTGHFSAPDADSTERAVGEAQVVRKEEVITEILNLLNDPNAAAYSECSKEMQAYLSYVASDLLNAGGIIQKDSINTEDQTYQAWETDETISLYTYLNYAISQNWVDTAKLKQYVEDESSYSDLNQVYQGMVSYIAEALSKDSEFDKLIYRYMIKTGRITGSQVCMILYEQDVLEYDETQYNNLASGAVGPYDFIRGKLETLEITPGQLGLEPCTGSLVAIHPQTGEVLACVSYPGYDNNRLANTMDSSYYSQLSHDQAAPLFNNATQEKTAPGSTFKPMVATAGLTEGVINTGSIVTCNGVFDKFTQNPPKCWVYPNSHGSLNVTGAIQHSCNVFFYEVGYRLGSASQSLNGEEDTGYSSDRGLAKLQEYATLFGLGQTTGIEIPESEPQISDKDAVRSAIGQGTNNYTTTQLARYITAVANRGIVYNISVLDKIVDKNGQTVEDFTPEVLNQIDTVSSSTWDAVQAGMRGVVTSSNTYSSLGDFAMSGKTGTAQQSKTHANHGLFVGYAPSNDPEIAFAIRIKNGYESLYPSEIGRDLMRYYYGLADRSELVTGHAAEIGVSTGHGD
ncbi:penicillin-binding transpeptidase domain-containing protein [Bariatricus massiliensis]|uniref:Penicillin-binding protein n=1 Tax=Bariatricus massiliensis TaxID=1745713 RepID=A0ABS8DCN5_9FIRM|nr:penicillin-binding transpeptidase domain-containing protein [Bariatricus massiliensis]MCB7303378.1 penicillin-binding protein [Bariatricus massiliensis]MCB7373510.1 penicillin-binding protein [Bariatricus massiliensis]MCB7386180.1 penicillin-binding protein [Bariatricus massiliensis]MCB7410342.1 penicillin-binding protein [Bariatricus massiliensis]MCQ5252374.1 penicillin-binding transpeptidase domain-containing protein [Bariatricus massiliensis]